MALATENKRGLTYQLSKFGYKFIDFSSTCNKPVLDVGAAYGIATIAALETGAKVFAIDIDQKHLDAIEANTTFDLKTRLTTILGEFPHVDFEDNSLSAVYISQVFPFLTGEEIELAAKKIYKWLEPGGKLFVVSFTPYLKHCQSYLPVYERKKQNNIKWAGYISDLSTYSFNNPIADLLPGSINHIDRDDLIRTFSSIFEIETLEYFGDENNALPEWIKYDGRERVGMIARKNESIL